MTTRLIKKNDFEFLLPSDFEISYEDDRRVQANCHADEADKQPATLDVQLVPVSHIEDCSGSTFIDKVDEYCKQYESETISIDKETYKDFETYFLRLKIDKTLSGAELKVNGMFAILLLDTEFCLVFTSMFDTSLAEHFEVVTKTTFDSIEIVGQAASRANSFKKFAEKMQRLVDKRSSRFEPEQRLPKLIESLTPVNELENLQPTFAIEGLELDSNAQDSSFSIAKSSRQFFAQFNTKVKDLSVAKELELIDDYYKGEISFKVYLDKIYRKQDVIGQFKFDDGRTGAPSWLSIDCRGFDSSFKFFGVIDLIPGWIVCRGVLAKKFDEDPSYTINISFPLDADELNWQDYEFSLDESLDAPTERVRYLKIDGFEQAELPDRVFDFTNLRHLSVFGGLQQLPIELGLLTALEQLNISGTSIENLPSNIGRLVNLGDVTFMNNRLTEIPNSLLNLSKLKRLYLRNNQLSTLPEPVDLPSLMKLDIADNLLTTLPASIAQLPELKELALYGNTLETLPSEVSDIEKLDLEIDQKKRLLNYDYQGADGKGMVEWSDQMYFAKNDQALSAQLDKALKGSFLNKYRDAFRQLALKSICIKTTEKDDYSTVGNTRFGGLPDLPPELPYPTITPGATGPDTGSQFIAQLNCAELQAFQEYLPRDGMLYFFLDDQESFECKVYYHTDSSQLISASKLDIDDEFIYDDHGVVGASRAVFSPMIAIPHFYNDGIWYTGEAEVLKNIEEDNDDEYDQYSDLSDDLSRQLGVIGETGFSDHYYPDNHHAINTYMFSQGDPAQLNAANALKGNPEDWMILLKVYSDGFCFWDSGEIAFVIHKSDLAKCDFSNVMCCLESS